MNYDKAYALLCRHRGLSLDKHTHRKVLAESIEREFSVMTELFDLERRRNLLLAKKLDSIILKYGGEEKKNKVFH